MATKIFVNLPVKDLKKSMEFYNVPQKLDHPISLEEGHWGERNDDDVTAAAQWRV